MNKKNTLSILLAVVIAFTALAVFSNTVSADQTDPQEPGNVETTEPAETTQPEDTTEPPETTSPAPEYDFSSLPDAEFSVAQSPRKITSGGYTLIPCTIDLVFGKVADDKIAGDLELNFDRKGEILDRNGNHVSFFDITNEEHNLSGSSALTYKFSYENDGSNALFAFAVSVNPALFYTLAPGKYTANVHYSSTWKNVINTETLANEPAVAGPEHVIPLYIYVNRNDPPTEPSSYSLSPKEFTFDHGGYVDINCSFDSLVQGKLTDDNGIDRYGMAIGFKLKTGTLKDNNNHSVDFVLGDSGHTFNGKNLISLSRYAFVDDKVVFTIYIKPADLCALPAGTYTGELEYDSEWLTTDNTTVKGESGSIALKLVIPETYIVDSGKCGASDEDPVTWTLYSDGHLDITGIGEMKSYTETTRPSPWRKYRDQITSVTVGNGVNRIGDYAFYQHYELTSVSLPDTVMVIGTSAFFECNNLSSFINSQGLKAISGWAFFRCGKLTKITLPTGLSYIGERAFEDSGLSTLSIPSSVTTIARGAFAYTQIKSVTIPSNITTIGVEMFMGCKNLTSVTIQGNVTDIELSAFEGCAFSSIRLPSTVEFIDRRAFANNPNLASIRIPDGIKTIEDSTFYQCKSLESIIIPESVKSIDGQAFNSCAFTSLTIPGNVETISSYAFEKCDKLTTLVLEEGVREIGHCAFENCRNISTVIIPESIGVIYEGAFYGCTNVTDIYCYAAPNFSWFANSNYKDFKIATVANPEMTRCHVKAEFLNVFIQNYGDRVNVEFISDKIDVGGGIHLYGYNLSLAGDIGVNFWLEMDMRYHDPDNYMQFTVNNRTQKVKISEAERQSSARYLVFRCGVTAKEMTDTITAQFYLADGTAVGSAYTYTIREYANYILTHDNYTQKAKDVVKAMLNYGACSQKYFNYRMNSLANSVLPGNERLTQISSPDAIGIKTPGEGCITPAKVSLVLNSTVTLKLYFNRQDAGHKIFERNGVPLATSTSGNYTVVVIDNISAADIHSAVVIDVIENNARLGSVMYSPAKYIKIVLGMPTDNVITDDLKLAVSSLYNFNQALQKYI